MFRHQFGFTIARRCFGLSLCVVFLLVLFGAVAVAEKVDMVRPTSKSKDDNSDQAQMTVQATMHAWREKNVNTWYIHSKISSDVHAAHEEADSEYNCTGWIKGSADTYTQSVYPTENLKWKAKTDSQGRDYHEGSYTSPGGVAYSAKKKHPVSHTTVSPTQERTRALSLFDDGKYFDVVYSPSQLENYKVRPRARAEVKGTARNNLQATLDHIWVEVEGGG